MNLHLCILSQNKMLKVYLKFLFHILSDVLNEILIKGFFLYLCSFLIIFQNHYSQSVFFVNTYYIYYIMYINSANTYYLKALEKSFPK